MNVASYFVSTVVRGFAYNIGVQLFKDIHSYMSPNEDSEDDLETEEVDKDKTSVINSTLPDFED